VSWLWEWRLGLGKLAVLEGDPGLGKSFLTLDLCARLSTGRPFPDGSAGPGAASCLVFNAEDSAQDTILPRLAALGADMDRVFLPHHEGRGLRPSLRIPSGVGALEEIVAQTGARLLVIDPILAFLDPSVNPNSDPSVRRALEPLADLAERYACAVLLVLHLNKAAGRRAAYRGLCSIAFTTVCRSVWVVGRDPGEPGRNVLALIKANPGPSQPSLAYSVTGEAGKPATIAWHGPSPWTCEQIGGSGVCARAVERIRAEDFLKTFLEAGPRCTVEIAPAVCQQRFSTRTLRRAKRALKIRSVRVWAGGRRLSYWLLPLQELPQGVTPDSAAGDLEPWIKPLREKYGKSDPLADL
jgi:hypothetical protein